MISTTSTWRGRVRRRRRSMGLLSVAAAVVLVVGAGQLDALAFDWPQFGGGSTHPSNNTAEDEISLFNASSLHRVWQANLLTTADGEPMYLPGVSTASGTQDLVFVTTKNGDIEAVTASTGAIVWSKSFGPGSCKINNGSQTCYTTSSPAVDPSHQFVYSYGLDGKVHKLAVADGTETTTGGWPEVVTLKAFDEKGSSALSTATGKDGNNYLYVVTSGYPGDGGDYQGHLVTVNLATGAQKVFNTLCSNQTVHFVEQPGTPDCSEVQSGVWARAGTMYDPTTDRIFISTGNATYSPAGHHWGDTVLAVHPDGSGNGSGDPVDTYTPPNFQQLDDFDQDLGSTLPAILTPPAGSNVTDLGVMGGKDAKLRLLNLANLSGHGGPGFTGGEVGAVINVPQGGQTVTQPTTWTNPADNSQWVFVGNGSGTSALKVVLDGTNTPVLSLQWMTTTTSTTPLVANGVLYLAQGSRVGAYNPTTGANLWQDTTLGAGHWQSPMVANGMLFMEDANGHLNAYAPGAVQGSALPSSGPDTRNSDGRLESFAISSSGTLAHIFQLAVGSGWSSWFPFAGTWTATEQPSTVINVANNIELFTVRTDGHLVHIKQLPVGQGWTAQDDLGSGFAFGPAAARNVDDRLEVFAVGTDGVLRHRWQNFADGPWSDVSPLGSGFAGTPVVGTYADGRLAVTAVTTSGQLEVASQTSPGGGWTGFTALGSGVTGRPSINRNTDGRLEIAARATNGQYVHTWQSGSTWAALTSLSTQQFSQPPALWINGDGRLEVFGITTSGALAHQWQNAPGVGWSATSTLGGSMAGPATATTNTDGRLEVFAAGTDHTLYHAYQTAPGLGFSAVGSLGGSVQVG
jgi:hypothetical protein